MGLLDPVAPPYDPLEWEKKPFPEKSRLVCGAWALQGYGTPLGVYALYAFKLVLYAAGWWFFCGFTPGMGELRSIGSWWLWNQVPVTIGNIFAGRLVIGLALYSTFRAEPEVLARAAAR